MSFLKKSCSQCSILKKLSIFTLFCPRHCSVIVFLLIQDTGISVRKRVIKILRDICLEQPDFHKITEMCVKMIRRVNDEEGIKVCVVLFWPTFLCLI